MGGVALPPSLLGPNTRVWLPHRAVWRIPGPDSKGQDGVHGATSGPVTRGSSCQKTGRLRKCHASQGTWVLVTMKGTAARSREGVCLDSVAHWGLSRCSYDQSELLVVITAA